MSHKNKTHSNQKTKSLKIKNDLKILSVSIIIKKIIISSIISNRNKKIRIMFLSIQLIILMLTS